MKKLLYILVFSIITSYNLFATSYTIIEIDDLLNQSIANDDKLKNIKELLENAETNLALEKLYLLIEEAENNEDIELTIDGNILLAEILRDNGNYKKSNEVFSSILPLVKDDFKKAQYVYFKKGGNFQLDNQIDSAKVNYEKAIFFAEKVVDNEDLRAKMHANLSGIFYLLANYNKAVEHSKIAVNYQKYLGNKEIEAGILNNLGGIYYMQGNYAEALKTFQQAFDIVGYGQEELQKKTRSTSFINMAYAYSGLGNYEKAFDFQDKYFSLNDSLQQELKYKEIKEIESKYDVATKEKEAAIEKAKRKDAEVLTYGLGMATITLLLGIFGIYAVYRLNKKNHALDITKKQLINERKIEKIKSETQSKILVATLDGRLEERKKISQVLHGNVGALLSAANLHLYSSAVDFGENVPLEIEKTQSIISEASTQVRDLSHKLISSILMKKGLEAAIEDVCKKSSNSSIFLKSESKNIDRFNQNFELKVYNIINELIGNMLKHSNAENGTVKLEQLNGQLQVLVFDDGIGFDVDAENNKAGIGLSQVYARIEDLKGLINIKSSNKGTRIFISIPIIY